MATTNMSRFLQRLTRGMAAETLTHESDARLVELFLARRDEAAFETLIRRHGPMVYRLCWRILQTDQDAEDAFQATFLVLAQKLHTLRKHASLASWLHGVAHRVALKARTQSAARRSHERRVADARTNPPDDASWGEVRAALDAELTKLADRWRLPLILCYLEGRTQDEAAEQLGWSKNTLRRRLDEAREALGRRLKRRDVWPASLSGLLLSDCMAPAAVSPSLVASTLEAAVCVISGHAAAVSASVITLTREAGRIMLLAQNKCALVLVVALGILGVGVVGYGALGGPAKAALADASGAEDRSHDRRAGDTTFNPLVGDWVMSLPAGFRYDVCLHKIASNRYELKKAVRFSGEYELDDGRLVMVKSATGKDSGFVWEFRNGGEFVLVEQLPVAKLGSNYLGATLKRPRKTGNAAPVSEDAEPDQEVLALAPAPVPPPDGPDERGNMVFEGTPVKKYTKQWISDFFHEHKEVYYAYTRTIKDKEGNEFEVEIRHGPMVSYYKNGKKFHEEIYRHGQRDGVFRMWAENGVLTSESHASGGKAHGKSTQWTNDGRKMREETYKDGKLEGEAVWWNADGETAMCKGINRDGKPWSGRFLELKPTKPNSSYVIGVYEEGKRIGEELVKPWWN